MTRLNRDTSKDFTDRYYTLSSTPSIGDKIYDENRDDSGLVVKSISGNTMDIGVNAVTLTINFTGSGWQFAWPGIRINDGQYYEAPNTPPMPMTFVPGDTVRIAVCDPQGPVSIIESSNQAAFPLKYLETTTTDPMTNPKYNDFTMPSENVTITLEFDWSGPV